MITPAQIKRLLHPDRPRRTRTLLRLFGLPGLALAVTAVTVPAAAAQGRPTGDRPTGVAEVRFEKTAWLQADGTLTVAARLECDPGWVSSDLTYSVGQVQAGAEGYILTSVPCDHRSHLVQFGVRPVAGAFQRGKATVRAQFLVFNTAMGDPSAGFYDGTVFIRLARV